MLVKANLRFNIAIGRLYIWKNFKKTWGTYPREDAQKNKSRFDFTINKLI